MILSFVRGLVQSISGHTSYSQSSQIPLNLIRTLDTMASDGEEATGFNEGGRKDEIL